MTKPKIGETIVEGNPEDGFVSTTLRENGVTVIQITPPEGHFATHTSSQGDYITTPGARQLPEEDILQALSRFIQKDWGDAGPQDQEFNDKNWESGGLLLGAYRSGETTFWIHRSSHGELPTVLLPNEY